MTLDLPTSERRLKNTARLMHQSMWVLLVISVSLMLIVRRAGAIHTGSIWILSCAVLAFMLSFALRDVVRKVGHRNTEAKLVKEVKSFLQTEPVAAATPVKGGVSQPIAHTDEISIPARADFAPSKGITPRAQEPDLVVFDAIPARAPISVRVNFYPVLLPVVPNC